MCDRFLILSNKSLLDYKRSELKKEIYIFINTEMPDELQCINGIDYDRGNNCLVFPCDEQLINLVIRTLIKLNIAIKDIDIHKESIEDYFNDDHENSVCK